MDANIIRQTLEALKASYAKPIADPRGELGKASTFSQNASATSGLTFYDLEPGAKLLYPVLTPLRNEIPRVSGRGGIQANWRSITGINSTAVRAGVSGGNRGGVISVTEQDFIAAYRGIGLETNVDFEAEYSAEDFDDLRSLAVLNGLQSLMLQEEPMILGGNSTAIALGTGTTPTASDVGTGGTLLYNTQYSVIVVPLTLDAVVNGSVAGGIQSMIVRSNADGSSDTFGGGAGQKSAAQTVTTANDSNNTHSITASTSITNGALGYAWFWGASGSELLGAITSSPSYTIAATATGTQSAASLPAADWSKNALAFDGLIYQAFKSGSNSYIANINGTLTSDSAGGVVQIDTALKSFWDNYRLSPDTMWVNSQQALDISKKILASTSTAALRFNIALSPQDLGGGVMVRTYLNRFSMGGPKDVQIKVHPNMPAGVILMTSRTIPYPLSKVGNVIQIRARREYYQIEWPLRSRKYEYGVYADQVLQHYFPPSMGVLYNITAG